MTSSVRLELVDRDQCCQEFGTSNDDDFYGACDIVLETLSEGNVYEDGFCKFVSQFSQKHNLSTGVTVFEEQVPVESFVPESDCCAAGINEACEEEEPIVCQT